MPTSNVPTAWSTRSNTSSATRATSDTAHLELKRRLSHGPNTFTNEAIAVVFYLHVLGATVWIGGLIVMDGLVPAVRKATDDRAVIQAMARRFGVISWIALGVVVVTGGVLATDNWSQTLILKVGLVLIVAMLAAWHSVMGSDQSPKTRGATQAVILLLSLLILAAALNL